MNEYDALEWLRAIFSGIGCMTALVAFVRARADLRSAEEMPSNNREHADERIRRILRMHAAIRWSFGVSFVLVGALVTATLAIQNHPLLAIVSNLNQILSAAVLSLLTILQIHDRTALALFAGTDVTEDEAE